MNDHHLLVCDVYSDNGSSHEGLFPCDGFVKRSEVKRLYWAEGQGPGNEREHVKGMTSPARVKASSHDVLLHRRGRMCEVSAPLRGRPASLAARLSVFLLLLTVLRPCVVILFLSSCSFDLLHERCYSVVLWPCGTLDLFQAPRKSASV